MTTTKPLDLEPIKARLAAATPGPWVWVDQVGASQDAPETRDDEGNRQDWGGRFAIESEANAPTAEELASGDPKWDEPIDTVFVLGPVEEDEDGEDSYELPISDADAALIANAPTDIAALVAEVERLRAELENTRAQAHNAARQLDRMTQGEHGA